MRGGHSTAEKAGAQSGSFWETGAAEVSCKSTGEIPPRALTSCSSASSLMGLLLWSSLVQKLKELQTDAMNELILSLRTLRYNVSYSRCRESSLLLGLLSGLPGPVQSSA